MKAKSKVQVRTSAGLVEAPCFHQWKQTIGGMEFEFALHSSAGHPKGFASALAISELGTGFNTKAVITHPVTRVSLTSSNIQGLKPAQIKSVAHAALHNLINKRIGAGRFLQAMLGAQMQLSKIDLGKYEVKGDVPALVQHTITGEGEVTYENSKLLAGLLAPATAHVVIDIDNPTAEQIAMLDSVLGGESEPKSIELPETKVSDMITQPDWGSPTEEEWYEGLEPVNKMAYLVSKRAQLVTDSKHLSAKATKADYDRIDDMDRECRDIEAKIKALTEPRELTEADLPRLRHRRDQLQLQIDQHGTMTGDTTEQDYEALTEEVDELDQHIENLEGKPCSN